jgi:myo-inositol-1(or 4)-monophosphatase
MPHPPKKYSEGEVLFKWLDKKVDISLQNELLNLGKAVGIEAGELLSQRPDNFELSIKSSAIDFATQMDKASEALIVSQILSKRPDDGIIAEEGTSVPSKSGITWVIDPLDGTVNYLYNMPGWNICIAAKDQNGVQVGVVVAPSINGFWYARKGGGAFYNDKPIKCSAPKDLASALIATGFAYDRQKRIEQAELFSKILPKVRDVRRLGCAGVDLSYVAMGILDGFYEYGLNEWDYSAGGLIATEAGALISGRNNGPVGKEMTIVAGPTIHALLTAEIG